MSDEQEQKISNKALTVRLFAMALGMFAFGFLVLPPMYEVFCEITGFGGRTNVTAAHVIEAPDESREIRIEFVTNVNEYAPWEFVADVDSMVVNLQGINLADNIRPGFRVIFVQLQPGVGPWFAVG